MLFNCFYVDILANICICFIAYFLVAGALQLILISVFGAIITSALSYDDYSNSGPQPPSDLSFNINLDNLGNSGGYPNSNGGGGYPNSNGGGGAGGGGGGGGGGGYDYTPQNQHYEHNDHHDHHEHHEHHEHHPEPPKGHWEKKLKWKEDWVCNFYKYFSLHRMY